MKWLGNTLITGDGSLFTVLPGGILEIRGDGWDSRLKKGQTVNSDRPRICKLGSVATAKRIAEMVALLNKTNP